LSKTLETPPKFLFVQVSNILEKPKSANRKTSKLNLYFVQKDFCDTCDSLGILLLTLHHKGSQFGGQFKGHGQSSLQNVLFDLQKELIPANDKFH